MLKFHWETTVFAILSFGLLYFILNKYAFGPLLAMMDKRRQLVQNQLQTAEENRIQAEELLREQRTAILDARKEAGEIVEQARISSVRHTEELLKQAREETLRMKQEALRDIESEKKKAIIALKSQVGAMSVMIASKIIEKQVDEKSQQELVDQYLREVGNEI